MTATLALCGSTAPSSGTPWVRTFWADLPVMMEQLADDEETVPSSVAACGPHFSVGLDLKAMGSSVAGSGGSQVANARQTLRQVHRMQASINSVADCPKPVIAAVQGYCIGGGVDLIAACDIRLAAADAVFSVRETKIAIVADLGSLQRLPNASSPWGTWPSWPTRARTSRPTAREIGLVNEVLADHEGVVKAAAEIGGRDRRQLTARRAGDQGGAGGRCRP